MNRTNRRARRVPTEAEIIDEIRCTVESIASDCDDGSAAEEMAEDRQWATEAIEDLVGFRVQVQKRIEACSQAARTISVLGGDTQAAIEAQHQMEDLRAAIVETIRRVSEVEAAINE